MLFVHVVVLIGETKYIVNNKLENWGNSLESKGFKLSGSKTEWLECKFNEGEEEVIEEVIISVTLISKVDKFKY